MPVVRVIIRAVAVVTSVAVGASAQQPIIPQAPATASEGKPPRGSIVIAGLFDWPTGGSQPWEPPRSTPERSIPERQPTGSGEENEDRPKRREPQSAGGAYRTLCVRLCDGFPFPISFATTKDKLSTDARRCEQQCPSKSRLFAYRNPGQSIEDMVDLAGKPYRDLPEAFRYQTTYVADCTCRGNPWDAEALARHDAYAQAPKLDKDVESANQSPMVAPQKRTRQNAWSYRAPRSREGDD